MLDDGCDDYGCDFGTSGSTASSSGYTPRSGSGEGSDNDNSSDIKDTLERNQGCHDLGIDNASCETYIDILANTTIGIDAIASLASMGEAVAADLLYVGAISLALLSGGSLSEAMILAAYGDYLIAGFGGQFENALGLASAVTTMTADYLAGYTRYSIDGLYIGKDSIVSVRNAILGLVPESNIDFIVSVSQLNYDTRRLNGTEKGASIKISASNVDQVVGQLLFYNSPLEDFIKLVK